MTEVARWNTAAPALDQACPAGAITGES